jgi:hypothetical protein
VTVAPERTATFGTSYEPERVVVPDENVMEA